jgi:hypothetical protein
MASRWRVIRLASSVKAGMRQASGSRDPRVERLDPVSAVGGEDGTQSFLSPQPAFGAGHADALEFPPISVGEGSDTR